MAAKDFSTSQFPAWPPNTDPGLQQYLEAIRQVALKAKSATEAAFRPHGTIVQMGGFSLTSTSDVSIFSKNIDALTLNNNFHALRVNVRGSATTTAPPQTYNLYIKLGGVTIGAVQTDSFSGATGVIFEAFISRRSFNTLDVVWTQACASTFICFAQRGMTIDTTATQLLDVRGSVGTVNLTMTVDLIQVELLTQTIV